MSLFDSYSFISQLGIPINHFISVSPKNYFIISLFFVPNWVLRPFLALNLNKA